MNSNIKAVEGLDKSPILLKDAKTSTIIELDEDIVLNKIIDAIPATNLFTHCPETKTSSIEGPLTRYLNEGDEISDDDENNGVTLKTSKSECLTGLGVACRINTAKITDVASTLILPVCLVVDIYRIGRAVKKDLRNNIGLKRTPVVTASVAGSWLGAFAGGYTGGKAGSTIGGAIGSLFGGVGAAPGVLVGGLIGTLAGSIVCGTVTSEASRKFVKCTLC